MSGRLATKVAFITGAASGIGYATARSFVEEGAKVVIADLDQARAIAAAEALGPATVAFQMDVSREADWEAGTAFAIERFGKLDIVCNVAGVGRGGSIEDVDLDDWKLMIDVNLTGTMLGCKHGVRAISRSGGVGAIINVSSLGGLVGIADLAGYCASKGGVTVLSKSVALHCAQKNYPIRCISVHPTYVDTEMLDPVVEAAGGNRTALIDGMARLVPMGRVAKPQDIANGIVFAASDEAAMMSGSPLIIDGAQLAGPPSAHFN